MAFLCKVATQANAPSFLGLHQAGGIVVVVVSVACFNSWITCWAGKCLNISVSYRMAINLVNEVRDCVCNASRHVPYIVGMGLTDICHHIQVRPAKPIMLIRLAKQNPEYTKLCVCGGSLYCGSAIYGRVHHRRCNCIIGEEARCAIFVSISKLDKIAICKRYTRVCKYILRILPAGTLG